MSYCAKCGKALAADARFCANCGSAAMSGPVAAAAAAVVVPPIEYTIQGDNLQVVRVRLKPGQEIYAEAGKMIYKTLGVEWESRASGRTLGQKLVGVLKRTISGESFFFTYFRSRAGEGEVGFGGAYPGRLQAIRLDAGRAFLAQRDSFVAAESSVTFDVALVKRIGAGLFGGEGFILERFTGPGTVFIHGGGDFLTWELKSGETIQVDTGCVVGFDDSVRYDVQLAGGIKTALFGGEGLFLATLTGPGQVIVQSMTLNKLRRELAPAGGGEERTALGTIGGIFSSED